LATGLRFSFTESNCEIYLQNVERVPTDLEGSPHASELFAGQGEAFAEFNYRVCPQNSKSDSINSERAARCFNLSTHQENTVHQCCAGKPLPDELGISRDVKGVADYLKLIVGEIV
jgi:hypothetical protein